MTNCFKCGKILPGNLCPGEYVMCKECEEEWKIKETVFSPNEIERMKDDAMNVKPFGWMFLPRTKDSSTIEVKHKEIVLCEDCVYWQDNNGGYPHPECRWRDEETPDPEDYCSYGEKKDGDV